MFFFKFRKASRNPRVPRNPISEALIQRDLDIVNIICHIRIRRFIHNTSQTEADAAAAVHPAAAGEADEDDAAAEAAGAAAEADGAAAAEDERAGGAHGREVRGGSGRQQRARSADCQQKVCWLLVCKMKNIVL